MLLPLRRVLRQIVGGRSHSSVSSDDPLPPGNADLCAADRARSCRSRWHRSCRFSTVHRGFWHFLKRSTMSQARSNVRSTESPRVCHWTSGGRLGEAPRRHRGGHRVARPMLGCGRWSRSAHPKANHLRGGARTVRVLPAVFQMVSSGGCREQLPGASKMPPKLRANPEDSGRIWRT